ncbi:MAG TPA: hypothetical protein VG935_04740 [Patescibacteria group bacterium]|nr:hypothetical protein [Patescibacteria group bacterium]
MSHREVESAYTQLPLPAMPGAEGGPPLEEGFEAARKFVALCDRLDQEPSVSLFDPRLENLGAMVKESSASPAYKDLIAKRVREYIRPNGSGNFASLLDYLDIDEEEGNTGIFSRQSAKRLELKELVIMGPSSIESHAKAKQHNISLQAMRAQSDLANSFLWHYQEPYYTTSNLGQILTSDSSLERWKERGRKYGYYKEPIQWPRVPWQEEEQVMLYTHK